LELDFLAGALTKAGLLSARRRSTPDEAYFAGLPQLKFAG